jgi:alanine-glyoxylate transaminase / serine-glyoxylate transaminase / serine-pyruvate transaminase
MTVSNGREFLSIPGPTTVPDEVLQAMHRPAMEIYGGPLKEITMSCLEDLRWMFKTTGDTYIYAANGHGAWEAVLTNLFSIGDKVLVLASGHFALGWGEFATRLGIEVEVLPGRPGRAVDVKAVEARLTDDTTGEFKAVLVVQIDTATSVYNDIAALRGAIDAAGHDALFLVDTIASLGIVDYQMDEWGVDVSVGGSQKGLMTPPGLSFNAVSAKAKAVHLTAGLRTSYWDWTARDGKVHYMKYAGTAPVHLLYGLRKSLDMLKDEGLDNVFLRHCLLAQAVRRAVQVWSQANVVSFIIDQCDERADSVTTIYLDGDYDVKGLLEYCHRKCGVVLGVGIGKNSDKMFRIAHMGHINAPMILGTLSVVEIGLAALNIPHGKGGVQAAIDWLAEKVVAT